MENDQRTEVPNSSPPTVEKEATNVFRSEYLDAKNTDNKISDPKQESAEQKKTVQDLSNLLGPQSPTWWNDHRSNIQQLLQDHEKALNAPINKDEINKARKILKLEDTVPEADVKKSIAKAIGLTDKATDSDIRRKLERQNPRDMGAPDSRREDLFYSRPQPRIEELLKELKPAPKK